jgi:rod shape-determining protein MreB
MLSFRFLQALNKMEVLSKLKQRLFRNIGVDLGTANTIIFTEGKGYVYNEPSVIAFDESYMVLAIGRPAKDMLGKAPPNIRVIRPLADGVITDFTAGEAMVRTIIRRSGIQRYLLNRVVIGVPTGITNVEKRAVIESAEVAGAREVFLVAEPMAAAIGVGMDVLDKNACMVIDVGGGTTDIAVINYGGIVLDNTIRIAGDELDEAIIRYIKNHYYLNIGALTAERIKIEHGIAHKEIPQEFLAVKGLDFRQNLPRQITVSNELFLDAFSGILAAIASAAHATLERLPPELASDILDRGIILTGGGSLLKGLDIYLRERLRVPVHRPDNALLSVAEGTRKILESFERFQPVLFH